MVQTGVSAAAAASPFGAAAAPAGFPTQNGEVKAPEEAGKAGVPLLPPPTAAGAAAAAAAAAAAGAGPPFTPPPAQPPVSAGEQPPPVNIGECGVVDASGGLQAEMAVGSESLRR